MQHLEKTKFLENIGFCVYDAYTIHRKISDMQSPRSRMRFPAPLYLRMRLPVAKLYVKIDITSIYFLTSV